MGDRYPTDWPGAGAIDLDKHDLPHASSTTEWWYINSHLSVADGRDFSLFASFFRIVKGRDEETKESLYAHSLTWALVDPQAHKYYARTYVDRDAPKLGKERLKRGEGTKDPYLRRALQEVLEKGNVPYPDEMFGGEVHVDLRRLELDYDGNRYTKLDDGTYRLELYDDFQHVGCDLILRPLCEPVRHGDDGVVKGTTGEDMFYYFMPRCEVTGSLTVKGTRCAVSQASGWYDHEFGAPPAREEGEGGAQREAASDAGGAEGSADAADAGDVDGTGGTTLGQKQQDVAWNWVSVQFADGSALSAYDLVDTKEDCSIGSYCVWIPAEGEGRTYREFSFMPLDAWTSTRTFHEYPTRWKLEVPALECSLEIEGSFADQEFITLISKPAFWEGRIQASGSLLGQEVAGVGFVERSGFHTIDTLDLFFKQVSKETRKSVGALIPFDPTFEQIRDLTASEDRSDLVEGVDPQQFSQTLVQPVREITDRGGKAWRSYAALACCDVVGGDSREYVRWLAMPELMHVGSLIVDDVQDKSTWRRGGKTCHLIYGEPLAINAGTACYFLGQKLLKGKSMSATNQLRLYDLYFQALRAGHVGQAIDLDGFEPLMEGVVQTGDVRELEQRVLAVHRLKTAAPAGALARMGGVAGGGSEVQIEALGSFFEAVGLAFQIIDDVLNLRGFKSDLKNRGEDIAQGKMTMPSVKALGVMPLEDRQWLWELIRSKPQDAERIHSAIEKIEAVGGLQTCVDQARDLVEDAWKVLDPLVEDSLQKLMLRAFGWYILERHY